jgi:hypothetical protein
MKSGDLTTNNTGQLESASLRMIDYWGIRIIIVLYIMTTALYSQITPLWEAPDEPSHYLYIQYLAIDASLPGPVPPQRGHFYEHGYVTSLYEWYQLPLYYSILATQIAFLNQVQPGIIPIEMPTVNPDFVLGEKNLFVPTTASNDSSNLAPRFARYFSIFLGFLTLLYTHKIALLASQNDHFIALTATGFMAFIPQFTFLTGYITNDNLADLLATICLFYLCLLISARQPSKKVFAIAGLIVSLALLTKLTLLFTVVAGIFCLGWRLFQYRSLKTWIHESSIFFLGAITLPVLAYFFLHGIQEQLSWAFISMKIKPELFTLQNIYALWPLTYQTFWGRFGWANVAIPRMIPRLMSVISLAGLIGSLLYVWKGSRQRTHKIVMALFWLYCGLVVVGFIRFNLSVVQPQGRFLYPALPAFAILVSMGLMYLAGRFRQILGVGLIVFTFAINLYCLFEVLWRAYPN